MPSDQQQTETEKAHQPDGRGSLPPGWSWAAIGDVADVEVGGTPSRKNSAYWGGGIPWTSSGEVANCRISETRETISDEGLANSNAKRYPVGTVLIAMIGEGKTRGQSAILDITATTNQNVAGIIPKPSVLMSEYVWRWALGQYEITRAVGRGGNQAALNRKKVKELLIPVPPLAEQQEIVDRVDRLFAIANTLEKRIDAAARRADDVFDAVLAKAFKGELDVGLDEAD
jgi:type I restriction enzyme S subunit